MQYPSNSDHLYLIVHIPKCAGSTIAHHLLTQMGEDRVKVLVRRRGPSRFLAGHRYVWPVSDKDLDRVKVLTGHSMGRSVRQRFPGRPTREIVLIRAPLGRILSHYNFYMWQAEEFANRPALPFETWYATQRPNYTTDFFLTRYLEIGEITLAALSEQKKFDLANEALAEFWYVADYRNCNNILDILSREFGLGPVIEEKNVTPKNHLDASRLSEAVKEKIAAQHRVDQALYDVWRDASFESQVVSAAPASLSGNPLGHLPRLAARLYPKVRLARQARQIKRAGP